MRNISTIHLFFLLVAALATLVAAPLAAVAATPPASRASVAIQTPDPVDQYVLNMAIPYNLEHPVVQEVLKPWAEALLEQSGGKLVIRIYKASAIASSVGMAQAVKLGQISIGCGLMGSEAEMFPLGSLTAQGEGTVAIQELSTAYWRMFSELPELNAEFVGIKVLAVYAHSPDEFCMARGFPYDSVSLVGKHLLVDNPLSAMTVAALEALPMLAPQSDFKMLLADGIAEGVVLSLTDLPEVGIEPYLQSIALADLQNPVAWLGLHQGDWDMLPQDLRRLLTQASGLPLSQALGASVAKAYRAQLEALQKSAVRLHYFSAEERNKMQKNMREALRPAWQKITQERSINMRSLEERINKIMSEARVR